MRNPTKWHEPVSLSELAVRANNVEETKIEFEPVRGNSEYDTRMRRRIGAIENNTRDAESYWTKIRNEELERQAKSDQIFSNIEKRRKEGTLWET